MAQETLIRRKEVLRRIKVDPSTLYLWRKAGKFPPPARVTKRHPEWRESDVTDWLNTHRKKEG